MKLKDIPTHVVAQAKELWAKLAAEEYQKRGDVGSCILGDGIAVRAIPPGCRLPRQMMLIRSGEVAQCQGSLHYEACKDEVLAFLKQNGVDAFYNYGSMD